MMILISWCAEFKMIGSNVVVKSLFVTLLLFISGSHGQGPVSDYCISCICLEGCAITHAYWTDAGKPTVPQDFPGSSVAYESCYNNYECSSKAIQNYMYRYQRDCNNDGKIDCYDHAAIHRLGADHCSEAMPKHYEFQIDNCINGY